MNPIRILAILFGIVFIIIGVAGYFPMFMSNGYLLGLFMVDSVHNMVHIVSGILALVAATSLSLSQLYFRAIAVIYAVVTIAGFVLGGDLLIMHMNMADNILHLGIAIVALFGGFYMEAED